MSDTKNDAFYKDGLRFECTGCGECCKAHDDYEYVYLTDNNVKDIGARLGLTPAEFLNTHCIDADTNHPRLTMPGGPCNFLEENRCTVYSVRPDQCRSWPFWRENLTEEEWNGDVRDACPGLNRGRLYTKEEIDEIADERDNAYGIDF